VGLGGETEHKEDGKRRIHASRKPTAGIHWEDLRLVKSGVCDSF
jgi:hypothetical protein